MRWVELEGGITNIEAKAKLEQLLGADKRNALATLNFSSGRTLSQKELEERLKLTAEIRREEKYVDVGQPMNT